LAWFCYQENRNRKVYKTILISKEKTFYEMQYCFTFQ
jgi:hypothetical protein